MPTEWAGADVHRGSIFFLGAALVLLFLFPMFAAWPFDEGLQMFLRRYAGYYLSSCEAAGGVCDCVEEIEIQQR